MMKPLTIGEQDWLRRLGSAVDEIDDGDPDDTLETTTRACRDRLEELRQTVRRAFPPTGRLRPLQLRALTAIAARANASRATETRLAAGEIDPWPSELVLREEANRSLRELRLIVDHLSSVAR